MSYTCPYCDATSHHPEDERYRFCGRCNKFESECRVMRMCLDCDQLRAIARDGGKVACAWCGGHRMEHEQVLNVIGVGDAEENRGHS